MPATAAMHAKLVKADFHGSMITGVYPIPSQTAIVVISFQFPDDSAAEQESLPGRTLWNCGPRDGEHFQSCDMG
jgi:hypothetical protein